MKGTEKFELDFIVDKLTNSIQNTISGDSFPTEIARFTIKESKQTTKKIVGTLIGNQNSTTI